MTTKILLSCTFLFLVYVLEFGNGEEVNIKDYPYHVSVRRHGEHICSGALVHESWIITVASCVYNINVSELTIQASTSSRTYGGENLQVEKVFLHDEFDKYVYFNNIALLKLTIPVEYEEKLQPIEIAEKSPYEATMADVTGYVTGWKRNMIDYVESKLSVIAVRPMSSATCTKLMPHYAPLLKEGMLCAVTIKSGTGMCQGDPGAPLAVDGTLIGILSYGLGCETMKHPGVYTRISSYRQWISNFGIPVQ